VSRIACHRPGGKVRPESPGMARNSVEESQGTALNYSGLFSLYWNGNKRFRKFRDTKEWLEEINSQQNSPLISTRRAWGKELQDFLWDYRDTQSVSFDKAVVNQRKHLSKTSMIRSSQFRFYVTAFLASEPHNRVDFVIVCSISMLSVLLYLVNECSLTVRG